MSPGSNTQAPNTISERITFARNVYANVQELIRFMDQKSGFALVITSLLTTAAFAIINIYTRITEQFGPEKYVLIILIIWYFFHMAQVIWNAFHTLRARPHLLKNGCESPEMMFPLLILTRHKKSASDYLEKLTHLSGEDILANYAQQIMEVSNIYAIKQSHVNKSFTFLQLSLIPWIILITILLFKNLAF